MPAVRLPLIRCFAALALGAVAVPAPAKTLHPDFLLLRGEVEQRGEWLLGCDNTAACTMLGFPAPDEAVAGPAGIRPMAISVRFAAEAGSDPVVELIPFADTATTGAGDRPATPFVLDVVGPLPVLGFSHQQLDSEQGLAVIARLKLDQPVLGRSVADTAIVARFPRDGFAPGFHAVIVAREWLLDRAQESRNVPDGSSIPQDGPLHRLAAVPQMVSGVVPLVTQNACPGAHATNIQWFRFPGENDLWTYECGQGGRTFLAMSEGPDLVAAPLVLPEMVPGGIAAGTEGLDTAGMVLDWDFGILRYYQFTPGHGDCGVMHAWGYTALGWHLMERREMPLCMGLEPGDWIRTFHRSLAGGGPDE